MAVAVSKGKTRTMCITEWIPFLCRRRPTRTTSYIQHVTSYDGSMVDIVYSIIESLRATQKQGKLFGAYQVLSWLVTSCRCRIVTCKKE
jgi:hypothetical protein